MCIVSGRFVWQITIDCIVVRDDGNLIDSIINGTITALMDAKKPLVTVENHNVKYDKW